MPVTYTTQAVWFVFSHFDEWVGMFLEPYMALMLPWNSSTNVSSSLLRSCLICAFWWQFWLILRTHETSKINLQWCILFVASSRPAKVGESIQLLYQDYVYVGAGYTWSWYWFLAKRPWPPLYACKYCLNWCRGVRS